MDDFQRVKAGELLVQIDPADYQAVVDQAGAGVVGAQVIAVALLIGVIAFPGAFLAKALVDRMPIHLHTALLDAVVLLGGAFVIIRALFW